MSGAAKPHFTELTHMGLVGRMLALHEKLAEAKVERERTVIGHPFSATDRPLDNLVYNLYGRHRRGDKNSQGGGDGPQMTWRG